MEGIKSISKSIINIAKIAGKHGKQNYVNIYPDGRIMATDGFKLIEYREVSDATIEGIYDEEEVFNFQKPIMIPADSLVKKQQFEKVKSLPALSNAFLLKADSKDSIKVRTYDLETTTDRIYNLGKEDPYTYETIFPENPKEIGTLSVDHLCALLDQIKKIGIREVTLLKEDGKKPLVFCAKNLRGLVMPLNIEDQIDEYKKLKV